MSIVLLDDDSNNLRNDVAKLMMKGKSEFAAARALGIKVVEARNYWNQWKDLVAQDATTRDYARDHLYQMVKHYDTLIERSHRNLEDLESLTYDDKISGQINSTLKLIGEFEKVRVDLLQKAGLLEAHDLGDELAEREHREEILLDILRNDLCPACKIVVARRLGEVTNTVEVIEEYPDDISENE